MLRRISIAPLLFLLLLFGTASLSAQAGRLSFFEPADSLHRGRFWTCAGGGFAIYSGFSIGLYNTWYKEYERTGFHTFDDWGEWEHMDKMGHFFTAYMESELAYKGARWTGLPHRTAVWTGAAVGFGLQATVEVMDAFSAKWGFSWYDMGFNTLGVGLFVGQEYLWEEQRIRLKVSSSRIDYPDYLVHSVDGDRQMPLSRRAADLYGVSFAELFLKDYNAQTTWLSVNPSAFLSPDAASASTLPRWLNLAVGYGAENVFGGFGNTWRDETDAAYVLPAETFPRYRQFFLSPDIDFSRIRTRSAFLRTLFTVINWIKVPAPALEFNTRGQVRFHPFYW